MLIQSILWMAVLAETPTVDFDTDVIPRLTKSGCNAAACHGAAAGRGGFRLSLFGGDPAADYQSIVRAVGGRRINLARPADSLLLRKPTGELDHGGGLRFDGDSTTAKQIERWIDAGAPRSSERRLVKLQVTPMEASFKKLPDKIKLRVKATFRSGGKDTTKDVSHLAVYTALDKAAVTTGAKGQVRLRRPGQHHVIVQFLSQVKVVTLWSPIGKANTSKISSSGNWIDKKIDAVHVKLKLPAAAKAKPHALFRRVTLDLTGRLPSRQALNRYLNDKNSDRYIRYVNQLLNSEAFNDYWTFRFAKLLRIQSQPRDTKGAQTFHRWVRRQIKHRRGLQHIAMSLLTASGDSHQVGPANFYRVSRGPRKQAEFVSESLLGIRLRCANCHNHPLDRWTQDDYHGLAAIFSRIQQGRFIRVKARGSVIHPRTGTKAVPRIPGERFLKPAADQRKLFADWLTHRDNHYFAKAQTNRIWKALMGRGLFEPTDDLRDTNPATHPQLLKQLSRYFVESDYQIRKLIRLIVQSNAYQRSHDLDGASANTDKFYSRSIKRELQAEVLADAISDVTGVSEPYPQQPVGTRAVQLFDAKTRSLTLDILGRCSAMGSCESGNAGGTGLAQRLHLINGALLNRRITRPKGRLQKRIRSGATTKQIVQEFYERALTRKPTKAETAFWNKELNVSDLTERRKRLEDFLWSLLTSSEFRMNR